MARLLVLLHYKKSKQLLLPLGEGWDEGVLPNFDSLTPALSRGERESLRRQWIVVHECTLTWLCYLSSSGNYS